MKYLIAVIIILTLTLVLVGVGYYVYRKIRNKIRSFSRMAFGTNSLQAGLEKAQREFASTPKSVSGATGIYLPKIQKDFPQFNYEEMKEKAETVLLSYLHGIHSLNSGLLMEGTEELKEQLRLYIEMLCGREEREYFDNIKVHRTEIMKYVKTSGRCSIVFQSAVEYIHYAEKDGRVIRGRKELKEQSRYNIEMIYIQDRNLVKHAGDMALGLNCPNCGAPISALGAKVCAYCDSPVIEFNIRSWNFSSVQEVKGV